MRLHRILSPVLALCLLSMMDAAAIAAPSGQLDHTRGPSAVSSTLSRSISPPTSSPTLEIPTRATDNIVSEREREERELEIQLENGKKLIKEEENTLHITIISFSVIGSVFIVILIFISALLYYRSRSRSSDSIHDADSSDSTFKPTSDLPSTSPRLPPQSPQTREHTSDTTLVISEPSVPPASVSSSSSHYQDFASYATTSQQHQVVGEAVPLRNMHTVVLLSTPVGHLKNDIQYSDGEYEAPFNPPYHDDAPPVYTPSAPPLFELEASPSTEQEQQGMRVNR
ncbi:uncharacterized protein VTP21DRAFT_10324 [Calcarisporiella thermophila]|uniref:uncharacterized protein n=1 Tax=Calcarisporiella thermophila TaxID=911321 RepID=UPI003742AE58